MKESGVKEGGRVTKQDGRRRSESKSLSFLIKSERGREGASFFVVLNQEEEQT